MIGFAPPEDERQPLNTSAKETTPKEKEVPQETPGVEINTPRPLVIPSPKPDDFDDSFTPEIIPITIESPIPGITPEMSPSEIVEL